MDVKIAERLSQCLRDVSADVQRRGESKISGSFFHRDDVIERFAAFWTAVPSEFRLKVQRPAGGENGGSSGTDGGMKEKSSIDLPPDIESAYNGWKEDISNFFKVKGDALDTSHSALGGAYVFLSRTEHRSAEDCIRKRLLFCFFYHLKKVVGDRLNKDSVGNLAAIVTRSGLVHDSLSGIEKNILVWIGKGAKYDYAARRCGGLGCIFLMPGPESLWVRSSGYTTRREKTIKSLYERGINGTARRISAHGVADRILGYLFDKTMPQINYVLELNIAFQLVNYRPLTAAGDEFVSSSGDNSSEQSSEASSSLSTRNTAEEGDWSEAVATETVGTTTAGSSSNDISDRDGVVLRPSKRKKVGNVGEGNPETPFSMERDGTQNESTGSNVRGQTHHITAISNRSRMRSDSQQSSSPLGLIGNVSTMGDNSGQVFEEPGRSPTQDVDSADHAAVNGVAANPLMLPYGVRTARVSNPNCFSATRRIEPNQSRADDISRNVAGEMETGGLFTATEPQRHNTQGNSQGSVQRQMRQANTDLLAELSQPVVPLVNARPTVGYLKTTRPATSTIQHAGDMTRSHDPETSETMPSLPIPRVRTVWADGGDGGVYLESSSMLPSLPIPHIGTVWADGGDGGVYLESSSMMPSLPMPHVGNVWADGSDGSVYLESSSMMPSLPIPHIGTVWADGGDRGVYLESSSMMPSWADGSIGISNTVSSTSHTGLPMGASGISASYAESSTQVCPDNHSFHAAVMS